MTPDKKNLLATWSPVRIKLKLEPYTYIYACVEPHCCCSITTSEGFGTRMQYICMLCAPKSAMSSIHNRLTCWLSHRCIYCKLYIELSPTWNSKQSICAHLSLIVLPPSISWNKKQANVHILSREVNRICYIEKCMNLHYDKESHKSSSQIIKIEVQGVMNRKILFQIEIGWE